MNNGVDFDLEFINKKLGYYGQKWELKTFKQKLEEKESVWQTELKPLVSTVPDFNLVKKDVLQHIKI